MKKSLILKNKLEIDNLFENGKSVSNELILFKFINSDDNKFLFAVSSKKFKRAVDRNRIKRLMRESIGNFYDEINGKKIAVVYRGTDVTSFDNINTSIFELVKKIK